MLTANEQKRYAELVSLVQDDGIDLDLDCPCDRSILDVCVSDEEARELLALHDRIGIC